jgi:ABC-2 type transport system permease protein
MNWSQLRTILWLRWRLTKNQWARGGQLNFVLSIIFMVSAFVIASIGGIAGILVGLFALDDVSPVRMLIVWDVITIVFLFFWMIGLLSEIQRSETIDIGKLLHLPINLRDVFFINFLASNISFSIIVFLPVMIGLCIGLTFGKGWIMILLLPLTVGFIFMITSWTYCLRGWLITLMANPRRRKAVIAIVTFTFIMIFQLPNMFGQFFVRNKVHNFRPNVPPQTIVQPSPQSRINEVSITQSVLLAHKIVPFLWLGNGAMSLTEGGSMAASLAIAGTFGLGWFGLRRAYRTTIRFYQGTATGKKIRKKEQKEKVISLRKNRLEESIPFVSDETSALALAFFQNFMRATEIKIMLASNFFMLVFFSLMILLRHSSNMSASFKSFAAAGVITFSFLGLSHFMFNQFGFDRNGFRALVLSPVPRKYILQGKNLAFLPVPMTLGGLLLLIITFFLNISFFPFLSAVLQLITAYLILCMVGNLVSILVPYRVASGSMKPTKMPTLNVFLLIFVGMLFPVAMTPIFVPPVIDLLISKITTFPSGLFNFFFSIILLMVALFFYHFSLKPLGDLLQKREKKILEVVTKVIE